MKKSEVEKMIDSIGLPSAYSHFARETAKAPPFICYYYDTDNDFLADNSNYVEVWPLVVELYTDARDFDLEENLKTVFKENGLVWSIFSEYIDTEKMQMTTFMMEVLIENEE